MIGRQPADCSARSGQPTTPLVSDAELLERFVSQRDECAFAALMARHGPMVFGVCRRSLRHAQDAEDAFQATFLILVRKAAGIGKRELLGNWLYGVATRVSARARLVAARRRVHEMADMERVAVATREAAPVMDLSVAIDEEVRRLPAKYRGPVVLCYLEGHTNEEAAGELRRPVGTIKTQLTRAREILRKRLTRRGMVLSAAAIVTALSPEALAVSLPPVPIDSTLKAAMCSAAGDTAASGLVSAQVAELTEGALHTMFVTKMKTVVALALALTVLLGGASAFAYHLLAKEAVAKKTDKDAIQGTWKGDGVEANGKDVSGEEEWEGKLLANSRWTITADKMIVKSGDKVAELKYTLDPGKTPKTLDCTMLKGPTPEAEGRLWHAVYSLDGDTLNICVQFDPEGERPAEVRTKEGSQTLLIVLKREKK